MIRSTNMEHVEVLERLRDRWAWPSEVAALDAAIASLSAQQPAPVGVEAGWYRYKKPAPRWEDTKFGKWLDPAVYGPPREQHGYSLEVAALDQQPATVDGAISHADLCALSRVFNENNNLRLSRDQRINDWLGKRIAAALAAKQGGSDNDR